MSSTTPPAPVVRPVGPTFDGWLSGMEGLVYGGDYNPEQWPEEVWAEDVALMREAGVNLVSVGIFSWALLEPRQGEFDFAWLDRVIDLLQANGIKVDLGTPTASPPAWFFHAHPDARVVTREGTVLGFGSRGMASPSHPAYRAAAERITTELATRYGKHPAVVLWHVHNEYGAPVSEDYSVASQTAFRLWLRRRYGTLEALNAAWGTRFWGQVYGEWAHVGVPAATPTVANPAQRLDFARFTNDALLACFVAEREAIRAHSDRPVTTNFMAASCPATDLWAWAREVDIVSNDHYLTAADPRNHVGLALAADLTRSVAGGKPWMLLEHSTSAVNWQERNVAKRPGEMARNALTHTARGADAIMFFQWRASRSGAEKFHSAMLPHSGTSTRVWREVVELGRTLASLGEVRGSRVHADVAILWDQESFWAQDLEWRPSVDLDHRERVEAFYDRLWRDGITVDFAHPEQDLSGYKLVLAPASYLLTAKAAANLTGFVDAGGTLLVSYFSGIVDENDAVHQGGFLGPLRAVLGVSVEEFLPLRAGETLKVRFMSPEATEGALDPDVVPADVWADDLVVETADVVGRYQGGPADGAPAITRNRRGAGTAWYLSTRLDAEALATVFNRIYADAGITASDLPTDLEVVRRRRGATEYVFAINHAPSDAKLESLPAGARDVVTMEELHGAIDVPAGAVRVLRVGDV